MQIIMGDFVHRHGGGVRGANRVTHSAMHILTHRYRYNMRDVSHEDKQNIQHRNIEAASQTVHGELKSVPKHTSVFLDE